jgi:hypothetical protein
VRTVVVKKCFDSKQRKLLLKERLEEVYRCKEGCASNHGRSKTGHAKLVLGKSTTGGQTHWRVTQASTGTPIYVYHWSTLCLEGVNDKRAKPTFAHLGPRLNRATSCRSCSALMDAAAALRLWTYLVHTRYREVGRGMLYAVE